jgi:hypothetical protein
MVGMVLIFLITLLLVASGWVSATDDLVDKTGNKLRFTDSGKIFIVFSVAIVALSIVQQFYNDYQQGQRETNIRTEYQNSVKSIRTDYDLGNRELKKQYDNSAKDLKASYDTGIKNIFEALAKYGLKYDSASQDIRKLVKDSLRGTPDPILDIVDVIGKSFTGYMELKVVLMSKDAPSKDFDIDILSCTSKDLSGSYSNFDILRGSFQTKKIIATGDVLPQSFYMTKDANPFNLMFFLVKGSYKSIKDDKRRPIDALIGLNVISNSNFEISGKTEANLRHFFEESLKEKMSKKATQIRRSIFQLRRPSIN